jgi:hypothetical protein
MGILKPALITSTPSLLQKTYYQRRLIQLINKAYKEPK